MTTARSTQGYTIRLDDESALGTAAGNVDKDIRLEAAPTVPTATREFSPQANLGHEGAAEFIEDKPLTFEKGWESALTLSISFRRGTTTGIPPLMYFLQSGGWTISDSTADVVTEAGCAVDDFDVDASLFGAADHYGGAVLVETAADVWEPCLLASYDDAPDSTCIPAMDLPAIKAAGGDVVRMRTATVNPSEVGAAETLQFVLDTRGDYTSAPDLAYTYGGCALADLGSIEISRDGGEVVLNPVFHVADIDVDAGGLDAAAYLSGDGTDATTSHRQRQETSNFKCQYGTFAAAGGITNGTLQMISATINPNVTTIPIEGIGGTNVNGWQGYMQKIAMPTCDITVLADHDLIDSATKGYESVDANEKTFLSFIWATTDLDVPAYGIWLPACRQIAPPEFDFFNDRYQLMTLHFGATAPKWTGGTTVNTSTAMSPIYIAIHGND